MKNKRTPNVLNVTMNGEPWQRVDDLSLAKPDDLVYCGIEQSDGSVKIRFGDGVMVSAPKMGTKLR